MKRKQETVVEEPPQRRIIKIHSVPNILAGEYILNPLLPAGTEKLELPALALRWQ